MLLGIWSALSSNDAKAQWREILKNQRNSMQANNHITFTPKELIERAERLLKAGPKATYYAVQSQSVINAFIDVIEELQTKEIIQAELLELIKAEYAEAIEIVATSESQVSRIQATGHAQCATNLLLRFSSPEDMEQRHNKMAELMEKVLKRTI
jgi:hypothetical protein